MLEELDQLIRDRIKIRLSRLFIFQTLRNQLQEIVFQNSYGKSLFRADFDFGTYEVYSVFLQIHYGFLRAWRMVIQMVHNPKKNFIRPENFYTIPYLGGFLIGAAKLVAQVNKRFSWL